MSRWSATRAPRVLAALLRLGWRVIRQKGSHRTLARDGFPNHHFSWHDNVTIGEAALARIGKQTGLKPEDL